MLLFMQADALTGPGDPVDELENRGNKIIFALFSHYFLPDNPLYVESHKRTPRRVWALY